MKTQESKVLANFDRNRPKHWHNFFDYQYHREKQAIRDRVIAKGIIETDEERAVFAEMAKAKVRMEEDDEELEPELSKIPLTIDNDDIYYLTQFMREDWRKAYAYKYNNWLARVAEAKKAGKIEEVPDWIFFPIERGDKVSHVYFVHIGGAQSFYKMDAEPNDDHFFTAKGTPEERDKYIDSFKYPKGGLHGYELSDPVLARKGTGTESEDEDLDFDEDDDFDYAQDEEEKKLEKLERGEEQYKFAGYQGMTRKRAGVVLSDFLRRNAEGWNTLSQSFSGDPLTNENKIKLFHSLPKVEMVSKGRKAKEETHESNVVPIFTQNMIDKLNEYPEIGNAARIAALEAMDEAILNENGLTKNNWVCADCRKTFKDKTEGGTCPSCGQSDIRPNVLYEYINKMVYGSTAEGGIGYRLYPTIASPARASDLKRQERSAGKEIEKQQRKKRGEIRPNRVIVYEKEVIPYMRPQRIISLPDWEKFEPKTKNFYLPQTIDGKPFQIEPLAQKIRTVRNGLKNPEGFFKAVKEASEKDSENKIAEIDNEKNKNEYKGKKEVMAKLGYELASIWVKLELQKLVYKHKVQTPEAFESLAETYLHNLITKSHEVISDVKTGDVYDANIRQHQKLLNPAETFRWYGGKNLGYNPMKQSQKTALSNQEFVDRWNNELIRYFGVSGGIHKESGLYTVEPFKLEKHSSELEDIKRNIEQMDKKLVQLRAERDKFPPGSSEYKAKELEIKHTINNIVAEKVKETGILAPSPVARGIQRYITNLKFKEGVNQFKGEVLEGGMSWVLRGALRRIRKKLYEPVFVYLRNAETKFQEAMDGNGDVVESYKELKVILKKLRTWLENEGVNYATLLWQLNLAGEGSRKDIAAGRGTIPGSTEVGSSEGGEGKSIMDIIATEKELKNRIMLRKKWRPDTEENIDVTTSDMPMAQSHEVQRKKALVSNDPLIRARRKYDLSKFDLFDFFVAAKLVDVQTQLKTIKINLRKELASRNPNLTTEELEKKVEDQIQQYIKQVQQEQEVDYSKDEEEQERGKRQRIEDRKYRVGGQALNVKEILASLEEKYQQALKSYDPANPQTALNAMEKLNRTIDTSLNDPDLVAGGMRIKQAHAREFLNLYTQASLLNPDFLTDKDERSKIEQLINNPKPDGSGVYDNVHIPPQLMFKIGAALKKIKEWEARSLVAKKAKKMA